MDATLNPDERLRLLEKLKANEALSREKTVRQAWISVGLAALVLVALVVGAGWYVDDARSELDTIKAEKSDATLALQSTKEEQARVSADLAKAKTELTETRAQYAGLLANIPEAERRSAINKQIDTDPKAARLLPRAYVQIVDRDDRPWAKDVSRILEQNGIIVPGVEYVARAATLKQTDVRYYKKAEKPGAENLVAILRSAGIDAIPNYLEDQENNPKVRPYHYEVWFVAGSRNTALK